jgi:hypothetical protein
MIIRLKKSEKSHKASKPKTEKKNKTVNYNNTITKSENVNYIVEGILVNSKETTFKSYDDFIKFINEMKYDKIIIPSISCNFALYLGMKYKVLNKHDKKVWIQTFRSNIHLSNFKYYE